MKLVVIINLCGSVVDWLHVLMQVGHCRAASAGTEEDDESWPTSARPRPRPRPWSPRGELVAAVRPPNRTICHLYDTVLRHHQRTCQLCYVTNDDDVTDDDVTSCCCCWRRPSVGGSKPKRRRFPGCLTRRKKKKR